MKIALSIVLFVATCHNVDAWMSSGSVSSSSVNCFRSISTRPSRLLAAAASTTMMTTLDGNEIRGPLTPLGNFCLVKTKEALSASEGGILIPDQVSEVSGWIHDSYIGTFPTGIAI